ncbi:MAG: adenosylhomocysteinase [Thermofilum sp. ex4484_15]|nr:MAG: adenosylhomocysteinase [Thermofilum sp. ex4484_15]
MVVIKDEYAIKDPSLAEKGLTKIYWAQRQMPVLSKVKEEFEKTKPLEGITISGSLHVTKETAVLVLTLKAGGAKVYLAPSNPLSTQDEVAAALASLGIHVYAWRNMSVKEYFYAIVKAVSSGPDVTLDDGADLTVTLHKLYYEEEAPELKEVKTDVKEVKGVADKVIGGTEETTTGVHRLKALAEEGKLLYPIIAVNDSLTKYLFDNRYGTGQSTLDGIIRSTGLLLAGKVVVVAGYGWCGRGIAMRAKGMGARVIVTEVDPIKALEAVFDGFEVKTMKEAAKVGDLFITATGNINVIRAEHFKLMKDGAVLANAGHFNVEINLSDLKRLSRTRRKVNEFVEEFTLLDGRRLYLLAEGRLVNLVAAEGHPSEVMDMSFSNQALAVKYLLDNKGKLSKTVHKLPLELDKKIAYLKLESMGINVDKLTKEQIEYLKEWR